MPLLEPMRDLFPCEILKLAWLRSLSWVAQQVNAEPMVTLGLLFSPGIADNAARRESPGRGRMRDVTYQPGFHGLI